MNKLISAVVALSITASAAGAANLAEAPIVFKSDDWSVRRTLDQMTDRPSCTALFRERYDIQVKPDAFYISTKGRGGISSYRLRYDDDVALPLKVASPLEKSLSAIWIQSADIPRVIAAKRLRVSALTLIGGSIDEDIPLNGLREAHEFLASPACK